MHRVAFPGAVRVQMDWKKSDVLDWMGWFARYTKVDRPVGQENMQRRPTARPLGLRFSQPSFCRCMVSWSAPTIGRQILWQTPLLTAPLYFLILSPGKNEVQAAKNLICLA